MTVAVEELVITARWRGQEARRGARDTRDEISSITRQTERLNMVVTRAGQLFGVTFGVEMIRRIALAGVEMANLASQAEATANTFGILAQRAGTDATTELAKLRAVTQGAMSDLELMQRVGAAVDSGLTFDQARVALQFLRAHSLAFGKDFNQLVQTIFTGLARGSVLFLDDAGIILSAQDSMFEGMDDLEKKTALVNAAIDQMSEKLKTLPQPTRGAAVEAGRAGVAWDQFTLALGGVLEEPVATALEATTALLNDMSEGLLTAEQRMMQLGAASEQVALAGLTVQLREIRNEKAALQRELSQYALPNTAALYQRDHNSYGAALSSESTAAFRARLAELPIADVRREIEGLQESAAAAELQAITSGREAESLEKRRLEIAREILDLRERHRDAQMRELELQVRLREAQGLPARTGPAGFFQLGGDVDVTPTPGARDGALSIRPDHRSNKPIAPGAIPAGILQADEELYQRREVLIQGYADIEIERLRRMGHAQQALALQTEETVRRMESEHAQRRVALQKMGVPEEVLTELDGLHAAEVELAQARASATGEIIEEGDATRRLSERRQEINRILNEGAGILTRIAPQYQGFFDAAASFAQGDSVGGFVATIHGALDVLGVARNSQDEYTRAIARTNQELLRVARTRLTILDRLPGGEDFVNTRQLAAAQPLIDILDTIRQDLVNQRSLDRVARGDVELPEALVGGREDDILQWLQNTGNMVSGASVERDAIRQWLTALASQGKEGLIDEDIRDAFGTDDYLSVAEDILELTGAFGTLESEVTRSAKAVAALADAEERAISLGARGEEAALLATFSGRLQLAGGDRYEQQRILREMNGAIQALKQTEMAKIRGLQFSAAGGDVGVSGASGAGDFSGAAKPVVNPAAASGASIIVNYYDEVVDVSGAERIDLYWSDALHLQRADLSQFGVKQWSDIAYFALASGTLPPHVRYYSDALELRRANLTQFGAKQWSHIVYLALATGEIPKHMRPWSDALEFTDKITATVEEVVDVSGIGGTKYPLNPATLFAWGGAKLGFPVNTATGVLSTLVQMDALQRAAMSPSDRFVLNPANLFQWGSAKLGFSSDSAADILLSLIDLRSLSRILTNPSARMEIDPVNLFQWGPNKLVPRTIDILDREGGFWRSAMGIDPPAFTIEPSDLFRWGSSKLKADIRDIVDFDSSGVREDLKDLILELIADRKLRV